MKIVPLSLYIINEIRLRRIILGISSRVLSEMLEHSSGYIGMIESNNTSSQYPPHEWPKLAAILNCEIHDLLPPDDGQQGSGEKIEKEVLSLTKEKDLLLICEGLMEYGFFKEEKSLEAVAKYLFMDQKDQIQLLEKVLKGIFGKGVFKN